MPFAYITADLEKHFVVVHWNQRGAGQSCSLSMPNSSMSMKQFVADTLQLANVPRARFGRPRFLVGAHSWGSMIAALAIAQAPDRFSAYLAICQAANASESERTRYEWALDKAAEEENEKATADLKRLGVPPYDQFADYYEMTAWISHFSGREH